MFDSSIRLAIYIYIAKTKCFIAITVPLITKMADLVRLVKSIGQPVPADSQVFIPDAQAIYDHFIWYGQTIN
jgi:hypothetical protein